MSRSLISDESENVEENEGSTPKSTRTVDSNKIDSKSNRQRARFKQPPNTEPLNYHGREAGQKRSNPKCNAEERERGARRVTEARLSKQLGFVKLLRLEEQP